LCVVRGDGMVRSFVGDQKTEVPCHSSFVLIKIPPCLKALRAEHRPTFCSSSPLIVTSPCVWVKYSWAGHKTVNNQSMEVSTSGCWETSRCLSTPTACFQKKIYCNYQFLVLFVLFHHSFMMNWLVVILRYGATYNIWHKVRIKTRSIHDNGVPKPCEIFLHANKSWFLVCDSNLTGITRLSKCYACSLK
jgi:hypothetical protein